MWILAYSCAFIAGVGVSATDNLAWAAVLLPAITYGFLLTRRTRRTILLLLLGAILFSLVGSLRLQQSLPSSHDLLISSYNDSGPVTLRAIISDEPDAGSQYRRVLLDEVRVLHEGEFKPVTGRILVTTADPRPLHYGDVVSLHGSLETPRAVNDFDYAAYLALSGIYSTAFCADIETQPAEERPTLTARLLALNAQLERSMASTLPEPAASLSQSLLLGRRGGLPAPLADSFARSGAAHILAISGLHLGILVAAVLAVLLSLLGRRHYLYVWIALLSLWTYALFTGMRPPVVRAAIMASTFLLAELAGRQKHAPTALAFAAAIMVAIEPRLLWSTSFQLSVLAMGGLTLLYRPLRTAIVLVTARLATSLPGQPLADTGMSDIIAATVAATLSVWPLLASSFGQLSLVGIPVSLLTLPVLPFALAAAATTALFGLFSPLLAAPFAWTTWLLMTYVTNVVTSFAGLSWAAVEITPGPLWLRVVYYAVLCATPLVWQRLRRMEDAVRVRAPRSTASVGHAWLPWALPPLLLAAILVWAAVLTAPDGRLHITFLDVGQGDSILIRSPSGRTVLVDGGPDGRNTCAGIDSQLPFWDRSIDALVITHLHVDHLGGLLEVIERYQTNLVLQPATTTATSLVAEEWARRVAVGQPAVVHIQKEHTLDLGDGTVIEVLHPPARPLTGTEDDTDNNGVVLRISYGEVGVLLTADIRADAERLLVHRCPWQLQASVLKVAHHGSASSSTAQFLAAVTPSIAIVSAGADNRYGHPDATVVRRLNEHGADVLTTSECGTVELITDGRHLWLKNG